MLTAAAGPEELGIADILRAMPLPDTSKRYQTNHQETKSADTKRWKLMESCVNAEP